jgi:uncharacterized protein (DUF58 family)
MSERTPTTTPTALTPTGRSVVTLAVMAGVVGAAIGSISAAVVAVALATLVVVGFVTTLGSARLDVERVIEPAHVERGRPAMGLVSVRNSGARRSRAATAMEPIRARATTSPNSASDAEPISVRVPIPAMLPGRAASLPYRLPTTRRGTLEAGPLQLTISDPLGLWRRVRLVGDAVTIAVRPRIHRIPADAGGRARHLDGPLSDRAPRGTNTFHSLRAYQAGDDIRRIHWKSTARTGTLMVREHVDTSLPSTVVVLDTRAGRFIGDDFEEAVDVAVSIVAAAEQRGFPVRLVTTSGTSMVSRAGQRAQRLIDELTTVQPEDGAAMAVAASSVLRGKEQDAIVVVSGSLDDRDLVTITTFTRRFASPLVVTIASGAEQRWTQGRHVVGADAATAIATLAVSGRSLRGAA